jgi:hypothetical protein
MRLVGYVALTGAEEKCIQDFREKKGNVRFGRPILRWEDNNKLDPREIGWGGKDSINLAQDRNQQGPLVN